MWNKSTTAAASVEDVCVSVCNGRRGEKNKESKNVFLLLTFSVRKKRARQLQNVKKEWKNAEKNPKSKVTRQHNSKDRRNFSLLFFFINAATSSYFLFLYPPPLFLFSALAVVNEKKRLKKKKKESERLEARCEQRRRRSCRSLIDRSGQICEVRRVYVLFVVVRDK